MTFLVSLFVGAGFSEKAAKIGSLLLIAAVLIGALGWTRHEAYRAGEKASDAKWVAAGRKLEQTAAVAGRAADSHAVAVEKVHNAEVAKEKEKIDEAERAGSSPLDVLFNP